MGSEARLGFRLVFGVFREGDLVKTLIGTEGGKPFHAIKIARGYHISLIQGRGYWSGIMIWLTLSDLPLPLCLSAWSS